MEIEKIIEAQRAFFATGKTIDVEYRIAKLKDLHRTIRANEEKICAAIQEDLGKSSFESYMCEVGLTTSELTYQVTHLRRWAKPHDHMPDLANFASRYTTIAEPYGEVLIMSPWNYPFMLTMEPLVGAVAAGNCCVLKPSAYSPATSRVIAQLVAQVFEPGHVTCVEGGRAENTALLEQRWDYIFFTGSVAVGKLVMEKASRYLTPITLELGGKSPVIVTRDANLRLAADRIVFGKLLNLGQTCVAPDYVLCDAAVQDKFLGYLKQSITRRYGSNAFNNPDYGHMVNKKHFDRVISLIDPNKVAFCADGGTGELTWTFGNPDTLQIAPVVMTDVTEDDAVMGQEIFGPILPILTYNTLDEAEAFVRRREKPLALYLFSNSKAVQDRFIRYVPFGGGCINDTIVHLATSRMPFGGVGNSGMGGYHGIDSFRTFSHEKSILKKYNFIDMPMRNQPYNNVKRLMIRMFLH